MIDQTVLKRLATRFTIVTFLGLGTFPLVPEVFASVVNIDQSNDPAWLAFKAKQKKTYQNSKEEAARYQIFKVNLDKISRLNDENEKVNGQRPFGVNAFTDIDEAEFAKTYLNYQRDHDPRTMDAVPLNAKQRAAAALPAQIDWSTKGATTPIKNQGQCGSCWAFSATEELETSIYLATGTLPVLSAQQVTSCSTGDGGCNGGDTVSAYSYMISSGVESDQSYPYTSGNGSTGSCNFNASDVVAHMQSWSYGVSPCSDSSCSSQASLEPSLQQAIANQGPASICLNATPWQHYTGGVLAATCASDMGSMNHCVQLVGYNAPSSGTSYWIARNQWGTSWGLNGFIWLSMGSNQCGLANEVTYVNSGSTPTPTPTPTQTPTPVPTPTPTPTPAPIGSGLISVSTDRSSYRAGSTVRISVQIKSSAGSRVSGAPVELSIQNPNGSVLKRNGMTNSNGTLNVQYSIRRTDPSGVYTVVGTSMENGQTLSASSSFEVN